MTITPCCKALSKPDVHSARRVPQAITLLICLFPLLTLMETARYPDSA